MLLCSILIPSRGRPERLAKTIASFFKEADYREDFEVLVRLDDDDPQLPDYYCDVIEDQPFVRPTQGPRLDGYASLHLFYEELAKHSLGQWLWIMNDDAYVTGPWYDRLVEAPARSIVFPEHDQFGASRYSRCPGGPFPIVPNMPTAWHEYIPALTNAPVDTQLYTLLHDQHGWPFHFLDGVTIVHERDTDDVLTRHRAMKNMKETP